MKITREEFRGLRIHTLAASELQRVWRGHVERRKAARRLEWEGAEPGPARIQLGLRLVAEAEVAFERWD